MSNETKILVCLALKKYKEDKQISYQDIANEIAAFTGARISGTTLYNVVIQKFVNDKGENILSEKLMRSLKAFLRMDDWTLVDTNNFSMITELCEDGKENSRFYGIVGPSQYGKTEALETYARKRTDVYYVLANIFMTGKTSLLLAIQKSMGITPGGRAEEMLNSIVAKLLHSKGQLIIDDAGKLSDTSYRIIQLIYDRTRRNSSIIIAGTNYLKNVLENGITRNKMGYEELFRRVEFWLPLQEPNGEEIAAICESNGLEAEKHKTVIRYIINSSNNFLAVRAKIGQALRLKDEGRLTVNSLTAAVEHKSLPMIEEAASKKQLAA